MCELGSPEDGSSFSYNWRAEGMVLDQILMMSPILSLATTTKAEDELEKAASTFSLIQRCGGVYHLAGGGAKLRGASSFVNKAECFLQLMFYPLKGFFYVDFCTMVQHLVPKVPNLINYEGHIKRNKPLIIYWAIGLWGG